MAEKERKPKSKTRKIIEWVLVSIFGAAAAFILAANISGMIHKKENFGYSIRFGTGTFVVATNSMEPKIMTGDMIITKKEDVKTFEERLNKGEVIDCTFFNRTVNADIELKSPEFSGAPTPATNVPMTHRLREVHIDDTVEFGKGRYIFVASGINENSENYSPSQYQLFTEQEYLGTVKMTNSFLGHCMSIISSPIGLIVLLLIPAGYLIFVSSKDILKALKESEEDSGEVAKNASSEEDHLSHLSDADRERLKNELLEEMLQSKKENKKDE